MVECSEMMNNTPEEMGVIHIPMGARHTRCVRTALST
jgi:hypothetical protein